jgi:uncharacterized protein (TIGR02217 family)
MSNAVFPALPGLKLELTKTPQWSTKARSSVNGREIRQSFFSVPIWKINLSYEVLRTYTLASELAQIVGFFNARRGSFDSFLYNDSGDNTTTDQIFGYVAAGQMAYQLVRDMGGFLEPVGAAQGVPVLKADGVVINPLHYSIDDNALVTFTTLPAVDSELTWSGQFYYRVRFVDDAMEFTRFNKQLWQAKKISLISVKAFQ